MSNRTPAAGGFFIMAGIMIGFGWGVAKGDAMKGVLIGTAVGVATAVVLWLVDRRRA